MRRLPLALILIQLTSLAEITQAHAGAEARLDSVEIEGRLLEPKDKLERFLGLTEGAPFGEKEQNRIDADLNLLGYRVLDTKIDPGPRGIRLRLRIEPLRLVRVIQVHGNWPLFDDEILRHLSVRSGDRLKPDDELAEFLIDEAARVKQFLERDGYFGGSVKIIPRQGPRPEWVDLDIRVSLGDWFKLGSVALKPGDPRFGMLPITDQELFEIFGNHCCFRWGRFSVTRMREDARAAEKKLRDRGYPAARVTPDFDFARDADPQTRRIRLPVTVNQKWRVVVKFVGNRVVPDRELQDQLTIFATGAYDDVELADSARAVQRFYQQKGYYESKVNFRRHKISDTLQQVSFFIDEGPELKVRSVEYVSPSGGALSFGADEIRVRAGIETKVFPTLGVIGLGSGGYVTNVQLSQDAERIVAFYKSRGFPDVKVSTEVARDPSSFGALGALGAETAGAIDKREDLYVRFAIDEGKRELVETVAVDFVGPHKKRPDQILNRLRMTRGQPYTEEAFDADKKRIAELYQTTGQPYLTVDWKQSQWNEAHDRYNLIYRIQEDGDAVFGEILIRGNFKTRDRVILKDLPFKPGDPFDLDKLDEGARNLRTHLIFNTVEVKPVDPMKEHLRRVPVLVTVQERYLERAGSLQLAGGAATDKLPYYVYLQAGWVWGNFFGFGSQIELKAETGFSDQSIGASLRYTDLRAFGPGWRTDLSGFWRRDITVRLGPIETKGLSVGLTRYLSPSLRLFGRYDIYQAQIGVGFNRIAGPNDQATVNDNTITSKVSLGVVWDRRVGADDQLNPLAPVKGWLFSAGVGWATPYLGGDHHFVVFSGQALGILPFKLHGAQFTLLGNLRFDEGIPIGESALPLVERFFAGGDTTTRGYDTDQLKTEIVRSSVPPLAGGFGFRVIPQGGNIRVLSTVELQFPIAKTFLGLPFPWVGAIFYDAGTIVDAPNLFGWSDLKHSIGVSLLRIITPVGPLSFDYAYPLTQSIAEERWKTNPWYSHYPGRIHFNWGIPLSR